MFLDRDGVLNVDRKHYAYSLSHFVLIDGAVEALQTLKAAGYLLIVATNQSGIAQGLYTREQMQACHDYLQRSCGHIIDHIYYSPGHPTKSESLSRKPGSLMFEKGIAKYGVNPSCSWMVGDKARDLIPAKKLGLKTIQVGGGADESADFACVDLRQAVSIILAP